MSNDNTHNDNTKYYDLHISGIGYLYDARNVKPKQGSRRFTPFLAVRVSAIHGKSDQINYTYFDAKVVGSDAEAVIRRYMDQINAKADANEEKPKVLVSFKLGDLTPETFTFQKGEHQGETGVSLKTRLLRIEWVRIDGEEVYTAPAHEGDSESDQGTPSDSDEPNQQEEPESPFEEEPGDSVSLEKSDPDFDAKKAWLKKHGYRWNPGHKAWVRDQAA